MERNNNTTTNNNAAGSQNVLTSNFSPDLSPLKKPLGFIRLLQWVFSIFAFATTGGYSGTSSMNVVCHGKTHKVDVDFSYPFRLMDEMFRVPTCIANQTAATTNLYLTGDYSSSAEFYVCIGVFAFLYCIASLVLYLGYQHVYRESSRVLIVDMLVSGIFAFLWLVSSSVWASGLSELSELTSPENIMNRLPICNRFKCTPGAMPSMGRLNFSVVFGFLNLILWSGNCWLIFKKTPFYNSADQPPEASSAIFSNIHT